jgi:hypothetical protein
MPMCRYIGNCTLCCSLGGTSLFLVLSVHFDPANDPIPPLARDTVLRQRSIWYASMFVLFFNIWTNVGFVGAKSEAGVVVFYSVLQFLIGGVSGGVVLYQGYRGVAGDLASKSRVYLIAQGCLTVIMIVFTAISSGNVHGLDGIGQHTDDRPQPAFTVICAIEGTMWLLCTFYSIFVMYKTYKVSSMARFAVLRVRLSTGCFTTHACIRSACVFSVALCVFPVSWPRPCFSRCSLSSVLQGQGEGELQQTQQTE